MAQGIYQLGGQEYANPEQPVNPAQVVTLVEIIQPLPDFVLVSVPSPTIAAVDTVKIAGSALFRGIGLYPVGTGVKVLVVIQTGSTTIILPSRAAATNTAVELAAALNITYEHPYIIYLADKSTITVYAVAASGGQKLQIFYDIINNTGVS